MGGVAKIEGLLYERTPFSKGRGRGIFLRRTDVNVGANLVFVLGHAAACFQIRKERFK